MKKEIKHVCSQCGIGANTLTCLIKHGSFPIKPCFDVSTFHVGTCDCCLKEKEITEVRDFFYPSFSFLLDVFKGEVHGQVGSQDRFAQLLATYNVEKTSSSTFNDFYGLKIIENDRLPEKTVVLVGVNGEILKIFNI